MRKVFIVPVLALIGLVFVIRTVIKSSVPKPVAAPVVIPPRPPYDQFVAGSGIIEARSENIGIASPIAGVVQEIFVKVGSPLKAGDPLFRLDTREVEAEVHVREAAVKLAQAQLADAETQLGMYRSVSDARAQMRGELLKRESSVAIARSALGRAVAERDAAATTLERMTVRSPIDGEVLQVKVRLGEFAPAQMLTSPLMLIGDVKTLAVRVDVDENDAWRVDAGRNATAVLRGNTDVKFPLQFVRFEPYVVPKRSLTGESTERVDTRVLQVIFSFTKGELPVFVGQLVDVYIDDSSH